MNRDEKTEETYLERITRQIVEGRAEHQQRLLAQQPPKAKLVTSPYVLKLWADIEQPRAEGAEGIRGRDRVSPKR